MKKLFLLFVASMLAITGAKAEEPSTLVATLNHEGKMLAYYGKGALVEAYNAARSGDVITLSAGTFTAVSNIAKNITIRGVGMFPEYPSNNSWTALEGYIKFTVQDNDMPMTLEGICCNGGVLITAANTNSSKTITFSKVRFEGYSIYDSGYRVDTDISTSVLVSSYDKKIYPIFINCIIYRALNVMSGTLQNCLVEYLQNGIGDNPLTVNNCVIYGFTKQIKVNSSWKNASYINYANLNNTLLVGDGTLVPVWYNYTATHCVGFSTAKGNGSFFTGVTNDTNRMVEDRDNFFKDNSVLTKSTDDFGELTGYTLGWLGYYRLNGEKGGLYELSDEAAKIYKGNDGTVVGVWGGAYPFNITPSNPRLTKCEIVPRVGDDGKLSVTIEVAQ